MNESKPTPINSSHYQFLAAFGLGMFSLAQYQQDIHVSLIAFVAALGGWMILFPRPRMPLLFVVLTAVVQVVAHSQRYEGFSGRLVNDQVVVFYRPFTPFESTTLLFAAGALIFIGAQFRLIAIKWNVAPYDPRFPGQSPRDDAGRRLAPHTRPESVLTPEEIVRFVAVAACCVALGQWGWGWLHQLREPVDSEIAMVVWLTCIGMFVGAGVVGYWRRTHSDPESARMYLQEIAWSEARREYGRIGRWIAWGKRKLRRK